MKQNKQKKERPPPPQKAQEIDAERHMFAHTGIHKSCKTCKVKKQSQHNITKTKMLLGSFCISTLAGFASPVRPPWRKLKFSFANFHHQLELVSRLGCVSTSLNSGLHLVQTPVAVCLLPVS